MNELYKSLEMSNCKKQERLSQSVEQRKAEMLSGLLDEVASVHRRRKSRSVMLNGATVGLALVLTGFLARHFLSFASDPGGVETLVQVKSAEVPKLTAGLGFSTTVANRQGIAEEFLVTNSHSSQKFIVHEVSRELKFETIEDGELLDMLAASGQPAVLGRINGKAVLIPTRVTQ